MLDDPIRAHLRAALDALVADEKVKLHAHYDANDAKMAERVNRLSPLLQLLGTLRVELHESPGVEISIAPHGHMATVDLKAGASHHTLSLATTYDNSAFLLNEHVVYSFDAESTERIHTFSTPDDVMRFILGEVGKHIASHEVLRERKA